MCFVNMHAARIDERAYLAIGSSGNHHVARLERTAIDEHRCNRTAALVEVRFDNEARSRSVRVRFQLKHVCLQQDGFEQVVDMQVLTSRNIHEHILATPLFGNDAMFGELLAHTLGRSTWLVDLVDRNHDGHVRRIRVIDSLNGLRHNAVVCRNHEHDHVGNLRTAGTHSGKCFVTRGIDERDLTAVDIDHRSTDVLGNAASFLIGNTRRANRVEQRGLAVVDVTHDSDHRRTRQQVSFGVVVDDREFLFRRNDAHFAPQVIGDKLDKVIAHGLGERECLTQHEQALDDVVRRDFEQFGELSDRGALRNLDH